MEANEVFFTEDRASNYDERFHKISPIKDALHLLIEVYLKDLPADANILSVGGGTGEEIHYLASKYPGWKFTLIDPSEHMLKICESKTWEKGLSDRVELVNTDLANFETVIRYDGILSILVSHFVFDFDERVSFFKKVHVLLREGGKYINADLCGELGSSNFFNILPVWKNTLYHADMPKEDLDEMISSFGKDVGFILPEEVNWMLNHSGFKKIARVYQYLFIHAWIGEK